MMIKNENRIAPMTKRGQKVPPLRRLHRIAVLAGLIMLTPVLSGCESLDLDKLDVFGLNEKKKLPGERKAVFPEGVPGVTQGIPPEYIKGNQQPVEAVEVLPPEPARAAAVAPAPRAKAPPRQPRPATAAAPARPAPQPVQQREQPAAWPEPAQQPAPQQAQEPWPSPAQNSTAPWPSAPPPGTFTR